MTNRRFSRRNQDKPPYDSEVLSAIPRRDPEGMPQPPEQAEFLKRIGRHIAAQRRRLGWTQETLAAALGISVKNAQRLESGKPDLRASSLWKLAQVFEIPVEELLAPAPPPPTPPPQRQRGPLAGLAQLGWTLVRGPQPDAVPVLDLSLRASRPTAARLDLLPRQVGWAITDQGPPQVEGCFIARVCGPSMAPEVPDGAWCLFRRPVVEIRLRATVLARAAGDGESGAAFVLKRLSSAEETPAGLRLTLRSSAHGHSDFAVVAQDPSEVLVAELVRVLMPTAGLSEG